VRLFEFALLADDNIHPEVLEFLGSRGADVVSTARLGLAGASDASILARAQAERRVVLTHDRDFETLAIRSGAPLFGVAYLRPGDLSATRVLGMLEAIDAAPIELTPPFLVVAHRRGATVRIRVRPGRR